MSMLVPISKEGPLASLQTFPYTTDAGALLVCSIQMEWISQDGTALNPLRSLQ